MCRKISLKLRAAIVFLLLFAVSTVVFIMFRSSMARTTYFSAGAWVQSFFKIADQKYFDFLEDYGNYTELAEVVDSDDAGALWQNLEMDDVVHDHHIHAIALLGEEGNPIASAGHFDPELIYDDKNDITEKIEYYNHFKYFKYHNDSLFVIYGVPAKDTDKKRLESGGYLLAIGNIQEMVSQMLPTNLWKVEYVRDKEYLKQSLNPVIINEFVRDINNLDYGMLQFSFSGSETAIGSRFWTWYIVISLLLLLGLLFLGCGNDTKVMKNEIELNNKLKAFLEVMPTRMYVKNHSLKFEFVNSMFAKSFGIPPDEFIGKDERELGLPEEIFPLFDEDRAILKVNKKQMLKMQFLSCFDNSQRCYSVSKIPFNYGGETPYGVFCSLMDISKQREKEKNIIEQNRLMQSTIDNLTDLYIRTDLEGTILQASRSCCEALGYGSLDEIIGRNITEVVTTAIDWDAIARTGDIKGFSFKMKNHLGKTLHCETNINRYFAQDGAPAGYEGIVHNVTERKQYEQQLKTLTENLMTSLEQTEEKNSQLENAHRRMEESMTYAKRIQDALFFPSSENTAKLFPDSFVLYLPCEIVGGDFYYVSQIGQTKVCIVADCTGHGVPGALMSVLSESLLSDIINMHGLDEGFSPAQLLEHLRTKIIATLQNSVILRDGLDIAVTFVSGYTIEYAGANIPLITVRKDALQVHNPTKCPIGIYPMQLSFQNVTIQAEPGDMIYMATDGFADQFGISENRKYSRRDFNSLLASVAQLPSSEQKERLENELLSWRGIRKQTDDITVFGFRVL
ncbi:MAG: SpoIIE family protein phosphatase [Bacteroidales bacterium]|nr:SpoIIE family protein phosphatase [Bacteroidales bacterium]